MRTTHVLTSFTLIALLSLAGCSDENDPGDTTEPSAAGSPTGSASVTPDEPSASPLTTQRRVGPYAATVEVLGEPDPSGRVTLGVTNSGSKRDQYLLIAEPPHLAWVSPDMLKMRPGEQQQVQLEVQSEGEPVTVTIRLRSRYAEEELASASVVVEPIG